MQEWSATQPTAAVVGGDSGGGAGEAMETVRRGRRGKFGESMLGYLQLVRETPLDELDELYRESVKRIPDGYMTGVGSLVRDAIVERMLKEDPDQLLHWVIAGKVEEDGVMTALLELKGFDALFAQLSDTQYPMGAARAMTTLFNQMPNMDREVFWQRALEVGSMELERFWNFAGEEAIDVVVKAEVPGRLSGGMVSRSFASFYRNDPERARSEVAQLGRSKDRAFALSGIGSAWDKADLAGANAFAATLESDRLRMNYLRAVFIPSSRSAAVSSEMLERVQQLDEGSVKQLLFEESLRGWKRMNPKDARTWSEANDQLEVFERLISPPSRPRTNAIDALLFTQPGSDQPQLFPPGS